VPVEINKKHLTIYNRTTLLFKRKVMASMSSPLLYRMNGEVELDETFVGSKESGRRGRSKGSKRLVAIGI